MPAIDIFDVPLVVLIKSVLPTGLIIQLSKLKLELVPAPLINPLVSLNVHPLNDTFALFEDITNSLI